MTRDELIKKNAQLMLDCLLISQFTFLLDYLDYVVDDEKVMNQIKRNLKSAETIALKHLSKNTTK